MNDENNNSIAPDTKTPYREIVSLKKTTSGRWIASRIGAIFMPEEQDGQWDVVLDHLPLTCHTIKARLPRPPVETAAVETAASE